MVRVEEHGLGQQVTSVFSKRLDKKILFQLYWEPCVVLPMSLQVDVMFVTNSSLRNYGNCHNVSFGKRILYIHSLLKTEIMSLLQVPKCRRIGSAHLFSACFVVMS